MTEDPIVASVRKTRDELAGAFGYDVHAIFADLRRREAELGARLVRQPPTPAPTTPPGGVATGVSMDSPSSAAG